MLNMSHSVDSMSFGKMLSPAQQRLLPAEVSHASKYASKYVSKYVSKCVSK